MKIDIVSGFLGAGKTTLIKKLLEEELNREKVALIENEFGEIGIDGTLLRKGGLEVREINAGCICCSVQGDLVNALEELTEVFSPERILIEPSGVGKLSDVMKSAEGFAAARPGAFVNMRVTVVDATKYAIYLRNFGEFFRDQVASARTVAFSRTQKLKEKELEKALEEVRFLNPTAALITTPWDQLSAAGIIAVAEGREPGANWQALAEGVARDSGLSSWSEEDGSHHHPHSPNPFQAWGMETGRVYGKDALNLLLHRLSEEKEYGQVLRAKGILPVESGGWIQFDYVSGEIRLQEAQPGSTGKLCVVGSGLNREALARLFSPDKEGQAP